MGLVCDSNFYPRREIFSVWINKFLGLFAVLSFWFVFNCLRGSSSDSCDRRPLDKADLRLIWSVMNRKPPTIEIGAEVRNSSHRRSWSTTTHIPVPRRVPSDYTHSMRIFAIIIIAWALLLVCCSLPVRPSKRKKTTKSECRMSRYRWG